MSLSGAIQALRNAVPSVPSAQNPREPREAAPAVAVPWVPPVPSEKSQSQNEKAEAEGRDGRDDGGPRAKSQNGEVSNSSISGNLGNLVKPLTDPELAEVFIQVANRFKLSPADLWAFLSLEDIEALRTGSPEEHRALWAFAASRSRTGDRMTGGHERPFPGANETPRGFVPVCCGDCTHFQPDRVGDGHGIGRCKKGIEPPGGPMYPKVTRSCRRFRAAAKSGES
jgi:hypothetical protein